MTNTYICCSNRELLNDGIYKYCINCGTEDDSFENITEEPNYEKRDIKFKYHHDSYKYNCDQMSKLKGIFKEKFVEIPDNVLLKILKEIPNPFTWKDVFEAYNKYHFNDVWLGFGYCTGTFDLVRDRWTINDWKLVSVIFTELDIIAREYEWKGSSKLSIWYILKKIQDLQNKDTSWIPVKSSKTILRKYEKKWKDICDWFGWKYNKLPPYVYTAITKTGKDRTLKEYNKIPPVKWEKEKIINTLKKNMFDRIRMERKIWEDIEEYEQRDWWRLKYHI